ncbi:hypothetical protein RSAG8_03373, partial [Rhizoctonia solani AG-8 WAC10335]
MWGTNVGWINVPGFIMDAYLPISSNLTDAHHTSIRSYLCSNNANLGRI